MGTFILKNNINSLVENLGDQNTSVKAPATYNTSQRLQKILSK